MIRPMVQPLPALGVLQRLPLWGVAPSALPTLLTCLSMTAVGMPFAFQPGPDVTKAVSLGQLTPFDYDGDGQADVVGLDTHNFALTVIPGTTAGYGTPTMAQSLADPRGSVAAGDISGDTIDDLICQNGLDVLWFQGYSGSEAVARGSLFVLAQEHIELFGAADLDGNGLDDLVFGGTVRVEDFYRVTTPPLVFFQTSPGNFLQTSLPFEPRDGIRPISLLDGNGDGVCDLVLGPSNPTKLVRFPSPAEVIMEPIDGFGELGDFNGDGKIDLFYLFHDLSTGTLKPQITHSVADSASGDTVAFDGIAYSPGLRQSVIGDFDGDGLTEVLLLVPDPLQGKIGKGRMIQWNGNGYTTGSLHSAFGAIPFDLLSAAIGLSAQDLDRDGADEVIVASASVRMQDALGNPVAFGANGYVLVDLIEAFPDLWSLSAPVRPITDNHHPVAIERIDANGDGVTDLVSLGSTDGRLMGWKFHPDHTIEPKGSFYRVPDEVGASLIAADFVGREIVRDVALTFINPSVAYSSYPSASRLVYGRPYFDDGTSLGEREVESLRSGLYPTLAVGSGDFDGDGRIDMLIVNRDFGELAWRRNEGASPGNRLLFGDSQTIALAGLLRDPLGESVTIDKTNVVVCDADGDDDPDIFTYPSALGNVVTLHRNSGSGTFVLEALPLAPGGAPRGLLQADMNGDGVPDLVATSRGPDLVEETVITVAQSFGSGPIDELSFPFPCGRVAAGDFDGDGRDELVLGGSLHQDAFGNPVIESDLLLVRTDTTGQLGSPVVFSEAAFAPSALLIDDMNADGRPDLIVASETSGSISILLNEAASAWPGYPAWAAANGLPRIRCRWTRIVMAGTIWRNTRRERTRLWPKCLQPPWGSRARHPFCQSSSKDGALRNSGPATNGPSRSPTEAWT
jgi:hypothetical protein